MIKAVKAVKPLLPSPPPGDYSTYNVERHAPPLEHLLKRRNGSRRWSELGGLDLCTNSTAFAVPTSNHNSHACALWRRLGSQATSSGSSPGVMPAETSQSASFDFCCAALCPVTSGHPSGKSQLWAGPCAKPAVDLRTGSSPSVAVCTCTPYKEGPKTVQCLPWSTTSPGLPCSFDPLAALVVDPVHLSHCTRGGGNTWL